VEGGEARVCRTELAVRLGARLSWKIARVEFGCAFVGMRSEVGS
jgi:hypothetical protein